MSHYFDVAWGSFFGYASYLYRELSHPSLNSYLYLLLLISIGVYALELAFPWRRDQPRIRRDFWLDAFYILVNCVLFSLLGYNAAADVVVALFRDGLRAATGIENLVAVEVGGWPGWLQLLAMFLLRDFIQYWIHRLLHRVPLLWRLHQVHHSVKEMGFAAHFRFHPAESVVYRTLEYLPLAMIGFGIDDFLIVYTFATVIGHLNHANFRLPMGPLRYVLNSAEMHLWHHAKALPGERSVNYGLTLIVWDYLFRTAHPKADDAHLELGFDDVDRYPRGFLGQLVAPFRRAKNGQGAETTMR